ncbi:MAG: PqiC family protein [Granulosicoccaceae bacterium]
MKTRFIIIGLALLQVACAGKGPAPRVSYYQLPDVALFRANGSVVLPPKRLVVNRVGTTDVLAQTGIVTSTADAQVITANFHHWSELPELALQRSLGRCLQGSELKVAGIVSLEVDAFQSDGKGGSSFSGEWSFSPKSNPRAQKQYRFHYREALKADGYPALVNALAKSVRRLCGDIAVQLRK